MCKTALADQLHDPRCRSLEGLFGEEVGTGVGNVVHRGVELLGASRGVECIADRNLMCHDEQHVSVSLEHASERSSVSQGCIVEGFAPGKRLGAGMRPLPGSVVVH